MPRLGERRRIVWIACAAILGAAPVRAETDVDFDRDVRPIFQKHCLRCHAGAQATAGLRLDLKSGAAHGGFSGMSLLHGPPEENELFQRITSSDRTVRMPKGGNPLSETEIDVMRQWIEAGCPWPDPQPTPAATQPGPLSQFFDWLTDPAQLPYVCWAFFSRYAGVLCSLLLLVFAQQRLAAAFRKERSWTTGRLRPLCALCARIHLRPAHYLVAVLSLLLYAVSAKYYEQRAMAIRAANAAQPSAMQTDGPYGWPPRPVRPRHPRRLSGTYYRGNCERNPALFNGGHYLTAWLRVELCDRDHRPVQAGDPLPESGLTVRFEIERAPRTAPELISDSVMRSVYVTSWLRPRESQAESKESPTLPVLNLEVLEPDQRWGCWYPLPDVTAKDGRTDGLIYVYRGDPVSGKSAEFHYAIAYDIRVVDGHIADDSELWLGSLYLTSALATPQPDKVPLDEWFDYRPIPPITAENTGDPRLLGIPETDK